MAYAPGEKGGVVVIGAAVEAGNQHSLGIAAEMAPLGTRLLEQREM